MGRFFPAETVTSIGTKRVGTSRSLVESTKPSLME
jgi:hypothetical protein